MNDLNNVYQSTQVDYEDDGGEEMELASPGKRIIAVLINFVIGIIVAIPSYIAYGMMMKDYMAALQTENGEAAMASLEPTGTAATLYMVGGVFSLIYMIVQIVLISKYGQSLGKKIMKIVVVDEDGEPVGFVKGLLLRVIAFYVILFIIILIPLLGAFVYLGIWVACLVMLFLVDRDRRTLQDMIAKTYVVDAE